MLLFQQIKLFVMAFQVEHLLLLVQFLVLHLIGRIALLQLAYLLQVVEILVVLMEVIQLLLQSQLQ